MRRDRSLGIVLPTGFLLVGFYLLQESTAHFQWYMDIYLVAGATIVAMGLMMGFWAIQRHLTIRRTEHHARENHQVGTQ